MTFVVGLGGEVVQTNNENLIHPKMEGRKGIKR